jgi:hypothetical protein
MSACTVILNPSRFVVGGGLGQAGYDFIAPAAQDELQRRTIPEHRNLLDIVPSRVKSPAIGAACLVWYRLRLSGTDIDSMRRSVEAKTP